MQKKKMTCGDCTLFGQARWAWRFGSDHQCEKFGSKVCFHITDACGYGRSRARINGGRSLFADRAGDLAARRRADRRKFKNRRKWR
jgi:hypothetical protein